MVLCGSINKEISFRISNEPGVNGAVGLSGCCCYCFYDVFFFHNNCFRTMLFVDGISY